MRSHTRMRIYTQTHGFSFFSLFTLLTSKFDPDRKLYNLSAPSKYNEMFIQNILYPFNICSTNVFIRLYIVNISIPSICCHPEEDCSFWSLVPLKFLTCIILESFSYYISGFFKTIFEFLGGPQAEEHRH